MEGLESICCCICKKEIHSFKIALITSNTILLCWGSGVVEFPKISIQIKYCKTVYEVQTLSRLQEIIQSPPILSTTR